MRKDSTMPEEANTHRMSLIIDADVAAEMFELTGERKAQAARAGAKPPKVGEIYSEVLRVGLKHTRKKRR